jgi:hypothetical protein
MPMDELKADCLRLLPGGKMDDSTYEQIEDALDKIEAPATGPDGRWLTLAERILALAHGQHAQPEER